MFDIGWQELLLIGVVALIVIGPKDMPVAMRTAARLFSKVRGLSRDFQHTVSEVMREAELDELRRKMQQAKDFNIKNEFTSMVDPTGRLRDDLRGVDEIDREDGLHHPPPRSPTAASARETTMGAGSATSAGSASVQPPSDEAAPAGSPPPAGVAETKA